jgi:hypothetical protein
VSGNWQPIESAPEDEHVLVALSLGHRESIEQRLTPLEAKQLLCIRDYIDRGECDNAMAALAHLFDHEGTMREPFAELEQRAAHGVETPSQSQPSRSNT